MSINKRTAPASHHLPASPPHSLPSTPKASCTPHPTPTSVPPCPAYPPLLACPCSPSPPLPYPPPPPPLPSPLPPSLPQLAWMGWGNGRDYGRCLWEAEQTDSAGPPTTVAQGLAGSHCR
ncbi:unnamed protein product [Closterium sp. NIES-54]